MYIFYNQPAPPLYIYIVTSVFGPPAEPAQAELLGVPKRQSLTVSAGVAPCLRVATAFASIALADRSACVAAYGAAGRRVWSLIGWWW